MSALYGHTECSVTMGKGKRQIRASFVIGSADEKMSLQLQADLGVNSVESFSPSPATIAH